MEKNTNTKTLYDVKERRSGNWWRESLKELFGYENVRDYLSWVNPEWPNRRYLEELTIVSKEFDESTGEYKEAQPFLKCVQDNRTGKRPPLVVEILKPEISQDVKKELEELQKIGYFDIILEYNPERKIEELDLNKYSVEMTKERYKNLLEDKQENIKDTFFNDKFEEQLDDWIYDDMGDIEYNYDWLGNYNIKEDKFEFYVTITSEDVETEYKEEVIQSLKELVGKDFKEFLETYKKENPDIWDKEGKLIEYEFKKEPRREDPGESGMF